MRIATWNVNSIAARLPIVLRWADYERPDVLCLQEIKCVDEKFPAHDFEALGYVPVTHGQPTYNGVAILAQGPVSSVVKGLPGDESVGHARLVSGTFEGITVVNVYIPNGSEVGSDKYAFKLDWLARLRGFLEERYSAEDPVLLCGDFNVAPDDRDVHDPKAWDGKILCSPAEREALETVRTWGFEDAFRLHTTDGGHFSWWDYRAGAFRRNAGLRIDHIWITGSLVKRCTSVRIDKEPRTWDRPSDHAPVVAEFVPAG